MRVVSRQFKCSQTQLDTNLSALAVAIGFLLALLTRLRRLGILHLDVLIVNSSLALASLLLLLLDFSLLGTFLSFCCSFSISLFLLCSVFLLDPSRLLLEVEQDLLEVIQVVTLGRNLVCGLERLAHLRGGF